MTLFFVLNPKYFDLGAAVKKHYPHLLEDKETEAKPIETKELRKAKRKFRRVTKIAAPKRAALFTNADLNVIFDNYRKILEKEAELARLVLQMEEEELAALIILLLDR